MACYAKSALTTYEYESIQMFIHTFTKVISVDGLYHIIHT